MAKEEFETVAMEPLSPMSQLLITPDTANVITFGFTIRFNLSAMVEGINNTLINAPRFCSKMDIDNKKKGELVWIPVSVQVEDHVIVPDLDYHNIDNPDQFIEEYASSITNIPMDMSKPLWEFHFLNVKTTYAESVVIAKIHHSIGDGMSLVSLLSACARKTSDPNALISTTATTTKPNTSVTSTWWLFTGLWLTMRVIFFTIIDVFNCLLTICFLRDNENPLMANPNHGIRSWKLTQRTISFNDKLVKNTMNMTVNDVLVGMIQAGLSKYLSKNNDGCTMAQKKNILQKIRVRSLIAVNLRPATKIEDLADMMAKGSKCRWGNFVGVILFPLWLKSEDDPLEYIRRTKTIMDRKKISLEAFVLYRLFKFILTFFGKKGVQAIGGRLFGHTTMTLSNVRGPAEEISLFDHPISYIAGSAIIGSQALIIHFLSYVDKIVMNVAVDTTTIPDPHRLCDDLVESLEIFKSAIRKKDLRKIDV